MRPDSTMRALWGVRWFRTCRGPQKAHTQVTHRSYHLAGEEGRFDSHYA